MGLVKMHVRVYRINLQSYIIIAAPDPNTHLDTTWVTVGYVGDTANMLSLRTTYS